MSVKEIKEEWDYIVVERLGISFEDRPVTMEQLWDAQRVADEHIKMLLAISQ